MANLVSLVEEQAEVGKDNPELLPPVTVLELPQEVARQLVLCRGGQSKFRHSLLEEMFIHRVSDLWLCARE